MDILIVILFIGLLTAYIINVVSNKFKIASTAYLWTLFGMHFLLTITYIIYVFSSGSDSVGYYLTAQRDGGWAVLFGTGTTFIGFLAWPFVNLLGLSYYSLMLLFSFFGFIAILLFYLAAIENIELPRIWRNYSYIELVFLLPNLHFWSASLGKGSTILLGLALFTYGLSRFNRRLTPMVIGGLLTYMVRPHILFTMVLGVMVGVLITSSGIKRYLRWLIFLVAAIIFYFISDSVVKFADTDSLNVLSSASISHKAEQLSKTSSGVDIQNYNLVMKLFTFWFRPLFFDGLGIVGIMASFENLFYLYMMFMVIKEGLLGWRNWNGWFRICLFFFMLGSVILAQISGNLGIAMRQKAQVMPFFFIVFCKAASLMIERKEAVADS